MRFQFKILLLISSLILVITGISGLAFNYTLTNSLYREIGEQALATARIAASDIRVRSALAEFDTSSKMSEDNESRIDSNTSKASNSFNSNSGYVESLYKLLDPVVRPMKDSSGASFITIADRNAIRVWHVSMDRIGDPMLNANNQEVLQGKTILAESTGSLGSSLRGKVPIYSPDGKEIVGLASAGYLDTRVLDVQDDYTPLVLLVSLMALLLGLIGSIIISRHLYRSLHGLEPSEIGKMYSEKQAILDSVSEGILSVDNEGKLTLLNAKAARLLGFSDNTGQKGVDLNQFEGLDKIEQLLSEANNENNRNNNNYEDNAKSYINDKGKNNNEDNIVNKAHDKVKDKVVSHTELVINGHKLLVHQVALRDSNGSIIGRVASLHDRTEVVEMMAQLNEVTEYAEAQRIMTHEYNNRLYLISGLIQLESYDEAVAFIMKESEAEGEESIFSRSSSRSPEAIMFSLLIAKKKQASEIGVQMSLDIQGSFEGSIDWVSLAEIAGNLIDNAIDAAKDVVVKKVNNAVFNVVNTAKLNEVNNVVDPPKVSVSLQENKSEGVLRLVVEDNGLGLEELEQEVIFKRGYTSKNQRGHGYGLARVKEIAQQLNALIHVENYHVGNAKTHHDGEVQNHHFREVQNRQLYSGCRFTVSLPLHSYEYDKERDEGKSE